jgi:hypothetical protein
MSQHGDPQNTFDAYHSWLGIPPEEQPPHFYRLLGLRPFETNVDVIAAAAGRLAMKAYRGTPAEKSAAVENFASSRQHRGPSCVVKFVGSNLLQQER